MTREVTRLAYDGSLVGATMEVDFNTLHRSDYVRIKIATKEITKIPDVVEGAIIYFMYDFYYERKVCEISQGMETPSK
jgi:hypothetical protein